MSRLARWWRGTGRHTFSHQPAPWASQIGRTPELASVPDASGTQPFRALRANPYGETL